MENGRRSSGSSPGCGLDHHELSGPRHARNLRRAEGDHVVVGRESGVGQHIGRHVQQHATKSIARAQIRALMIVTRMRYLRMFTNAIAGGVLAAMYLAVLVLQLNPHVPVVSMTALGWFGALLAMYGPYLTALILLAILGREALASRPLHPGWLSVRILAWLSAASAVDGVGADVGQPARHAIGAVRGGRATACARAPRPRRPAPSCSCGRDSAVFVRPSRQPAGGRADGRVGQRVAARAAVDSRAGRIEGAGRASRQSGAPGQSSPARAAHPDRRRVARLHRAARRRRPVAEFRQADRHAAP